ncbi:hypothetical protein [Acidaminococcus timonensis]|uniref:hypothetical protein n=1 Tax=Acidaminococcus timonensis TaxID=1871002 RepID=UPI002943EA70|nr:hypothetical protein [Acidaminococcus timonensis]
MKIREKATLGILASVLAFSSGILAPAPVWAAETGLQPAKRIQQVPFQAGPGIAVARTRAGLVQGYKRQDIYTYHGIPYAEAAERFQRAKPVKPWGWPWSMVPLPSRKKEASPPATGWNPDGISPWAITART